MERLYHNKPDTYANGQLAKNWYWYLLFGIGSIVVGSLAIFYSFTATIVSVLYLGVLLIVSGVLEAIHSFKINRWATFFLHLLLGVLYTIAGFFIIASPALNALTLTLFISWLFIISGIFRMIFSLFVKTPHRALQFFNGVITLILGFLIFKQWPVSGLWVIGTFVGIDLIFSGLTWVFLSLKAKELRRVNA